MSSDADVPPPGVGDAQSPGGDAIPRVVLTDDQRRILALIAEGQSSGDVATTLSLSVTTVGRELARLRRMLSAPTSTRAAEVAVAKGLLRGIPSETERP